MIGVEKAHIASREWRIYLMRCSGEVEMGVVPVAQSFRPLHP